MLSSYYVHNCNLPTFPTRRSSDLRTRRGELRGGYLAQVPELEWLGACRYHSLGGDDPGCALLRDSDRSHQSFRLDRKSTRLNSSHVRISYAVFCLKKKINPHSHNI